jgi:8-oxo-dGTP diphosphatase
VSGVVASIALGNRARRSLYPDVWDLPGGHVDPRNFLARSLFENFGRSYGSTSRRRWAPMHEIHADTFRNADLADSTWTGTAANVAPDEHDAIAWFAADELGGVRFAHDSYLAMFTEALSGQPA